jgi:hypothetical protein
MIKMIFTFLLFISALIAQENQIDKSNNYTLGEGIQIAQYPIYIGGYFSTDYLNVGTKNRYRVNNLALLSYGNYDKFSYMAEFEYKGLYILNKNAGKYTSTTDTAIHTERFYIDYNMNENYLFRVGKYNSPIGYWNLLPINVLRETTSNPISTLILFPTFTTGIMVSYSTFGKANLKVNLLLQKNADLDASYNNYRMDDHYGLGLVYEKNEWNFKLNLGEFDGLFVNAKSQILYYYMASLKYETEKFQIMSEIGSQKSDKSYTTRYAGYVQGLYHINEEHAAVLRLESYDDVYHNIKEDIAVFGYSYRPTYPVSIKTEYQLHSLQKNNQFLLSFSVLF